MIVTKTVRSSATVSTVLTKPYAFPHAQIHSLSKSQPKSLRASNNQNVQPQPPQPAATDAKTTTAPIEPFIPRKYQEEIFIRAQSSNIIAALDTGSGKTFISVLLIKWIVLQPQAIGKVVVFLVPKVALVEQQAAFITSQTPLRVRKFHGSLDMELSDRANWKAAFEGADVVVMTGEYAEAFGCSSVSALRSMLDIY